MPLSAELADNLTVVIRRVRNARIIERRPVPFPTKSVNDPTLAKGVTRIVSPGQPGVMAVTYAIVYVDGKLVGKTEISRKLLQAPITQLQKNGTKPPPTPSPGSSDPTTSSGPIVVDPGSRKLSPRRWSRPVAGAIPTSPAW